MMQHVHAGADRLCRERCGGAFERVARHVGAASDACTSASILELVALPRASLWQNAFKAVYEVEGF